ncbi:cysteine desulfurase family protein [Faecalibacter rhinopitheci]|uniref:cysteine desulfurase n=1 Tax=Faecalibacter rhinopitheci TaxID=2779678 RepID=A0A8J7FSQ3_9FLAO|nr:cysteine desulfurase family protein [Faecalibacter rhinopitheci]MBF0598183.1 cysteine desulfurase [Faecalibacter rhinopitheci]
MIYLDNASTTRVNEEVLNEMMPYFNQYYFNASSNHLDGLKTKKVIENARKLCAEIIQAESSEIIFTSGATESINYALKGFYEENFERGNHLITCKTEHKAVLKTCEYLETKGIEVTYLDVDSNGLIDLNELENSITPETALIAIMYANNETGVIQDIQLIGDIAKKHNLSFFCDATQAIGKVDIDVNELNIDMLCMSAHKINGPKGIGFLYVKNGLMLTPLIHGGSQENDNRGGTYNTPLIIGLGKACELAKRYIDKTAKVYKEIWETVLKFIEKTNNILIVGDLNQRLFNIINLKINNLDASVFVESSIEDENNIFSLKTA